VGPGPGLIGIGCDRAGFLLVSVGYLGHGLPHEWFGPKPDLVPGLGFVMILI
jgi:hypothetical protein